jgi:hypothetical protein
MKISGKMFNDTGGKFVAGVNDQWCSLTCEYLRKFLKKIRNHPNVEKKLSKKTRDAVPLTPPFLSDSLSSLCVVS